MTFINILDLCQNLYYYKFMKIANILTLSRIILSPVFFICFLMITTAIPQLSSFFLIITWVLFIIMEFSDLFDGILARCLKMESEVGKLLDPFADSISRITYFLCFAMQGIMPFWIFIIVLYRDLAVSFIRLLMLKRGITLGARISGKIKAWIYAIAGIGGLVVFSCKRLLIFTAEIGILITGSKIVFIIVGVIAVWSLIDYLMVFLKKNKE